MTLVRFNPTRSIFPAQTGIDQLFGSFFENSLLSDTTWKPVVDLSESKDDYLLAVEIPGMKKDDISISFKENILTVSGEKTVELKEDDTKVYRSERSYGKFERSFKLPEEVKPEAIKAEYKDGILKVHIPKDEVKNTPRMITVK